MAEDLQALLHAVAADDCRPDHERIVRRGRQLQLRRSGVLSVTAMVVALAVVGVGQALPCSPPGPSVADAPSVGPASDGDGSSDDGFQQGVLPGMTPEEAEARSAWEEAVRTQLPPPPPGALDAESETYVQDPVVACRWRDEIAEQAAALPGWDDLGLEKEGMGISEALRLVVTEHTGDRSPPVGLLLAYCQLREAVMVEPVGSPDAAAWPHLAAEDGYYEVMVFHLPTFLDDLMTFDGVGDGSEGPLLDLVDRPELLCLWLEDLVEIVAAAAPDLRSTGAGSLEAEIADAVLVSAWEPMPDQQRSTTWHAEELLMECRS